MDESNIFDKIHEVDLKDTMEKSYIDYAMSVIVSRALPDVRDGLKPVQRRILYSMIELNNGPDKPHRKCARIVGDTMGKYHPTAPSTALLLIWPRNGLPDTRWWTDTATSVPWTETGQRPCVTRRHVCLRSPWR